MGSITDADRRTFTDIDFILDLMDEESAEKIPEGLRRTIRENKLDGYTPTIRADLPIEEQEIHPDTQVFLATLYLEYWCEDEREKKELLKFFERNEREMRRERKKKKPGEK